MSTNNNNINNSNSSSNSSSITGAETMAAEATRHFVLGLPKRGPLPGSPEFTSLQAAEAFVGEVQQEILHYDLANARAVEAYARSWWERLPGLGQRVHHNNNNNNNNKEEERGGGVETAVVSSTMASLGNACRVERTSANSTFNNKNTNNNISAPKVSGWFLKRRPPGWVPLIQRWWVPCVCTAAIIIIWTPDVWKLRTLYWCDYNYAQLRQNIHKAYWRATMSREDYLELMKDLEAQRPPSVKPTNCPL